MENKQQEKKMGSNVFCCSHDRWLIWLVSIVYIFSWPQTGYSQTDNNDPPEQIAIEILSESEKKNPVKQFDDLQKTLSESEDPLYDARLFLDSFLSEMNARYGTFITIEQVCEQIKKNMDIIPLSTEDRQELLLLIDVLLNEPQSMHAGAYWPWKWKWFGLNKKDNPTKDVHQEETFKTIPIARTPTPEYGPPGLDAGIIVGGLEIVAGGAIALVFGETIIGPIIGGGMIADGIHRISNRGQADIDSYLRNRRPSENFNQ